LWSNAAGKKASPQRKNQWLHNEAGLNPQAAVQTRLELLGIQPLAGGMFYQSGFVQLILVFKKPVVILPEFPLLHGAAAGLRSNLRLRMNLPQRKKSMRSHGPQLVVSFFPDCRNRFPRSGSFAGLSKRTHNQSDPHTAKINIAFESIIILAIGLGCRFNETEPSEY